MFAGATTPIVRPTNPGGIRSPVGFSTRVARPGELRLARVHSGRVPTSDVLGADPEDLHRLAAAARTGCAGLEGAEERLKQRLAAVSWQGPDARELATTFEAALRRDLRSATGALRSMADRLEGQALEQRQASGDAPAGPGERPGEVRSTGSDPGGTAARTSGPAPLIVLTETHTLGLEAGATPIDGRAEATLTLSVSEDGSADVSVATDQRIGALLGEAGVGAGLGLSGSNELVFSFDDEATARSFVSEMTDALVPDVAALGNVDAPSPLAVATGLAVPAVIVGGGRAIVDDVTADAAGVLIAHAPTDVDGSVGVTADTWAVGAVDRFGIDGEVARGASYHPTTGTWVTTTGVSGAATAQLFGDLEVDLAGETSVSTTIGHAGVTDGTWSVEVTGGGAAAMLGAMGLGTGAPAFDPGGAATVRLDATLAAHDEQARAALNEFNQANPDPRRAAATLERMVREGELTMTVERRDASDQGRSYGPVRLISDHSVARTERAYRRSPGDVWRRVR